jgi:hypothetical protein
MDICVVFDSGGGDFAVVGFRISFHYISCVCDVLVCICTGVAGSGFCVLTELLYRMSVGADVDIVRGFAKNSGACV